LKRFLRYIAFSFGYIVSGLLLLSVLAVYISPSSIPFLAVISLAAPLIFLLALFIFILIIKRKHKFFFWFVVFSLVSYIPVFFHFFSFSFSQKELSENDFAVLSYNVRQFDHYNWIEEEGTSTKLFQFLRTYGTEIMCLQDFYQSPARNFNAIDSLLASGKWTDYMYSPYLKDTGLVNSGLAIFSAFPILKSELLSFRNSSNKAIYADVLVNEDTLRIYNLHLESINIDGAEYDIVQGKVNPNKGGFDKLGRIYQKLILAFFKRSFQAEQIILHVKKSPYPVVVAGDLNDTPGSYTYFLFREYLNDSFLDAGMGLGKTYISNWPWLRIDYIFYSDELQVDKFNICRKKLSDHYPLQAIFSIKAKE